MIRYALFDPDSHRYTLSECPTPDLADDDVLVRILGCTLCGSDLHTLTGRRAQEHPMILGHEACGVIEGLGSQNLQAWDGQTLEVGDRVTWSLIRHCGRCWYCRHGYSQKCTSLLKFGHCDQAIRPLFGGLAEACVLDRYTPVFKIPESLDLWSVCPANCATATCMAGYDGLELRGAVVGITGCGLLGLTAAAIASYAGASAVVVADLDTERAEQARQFGATHVCGGVEWQEAFDEQINQASQGRGADIVLEITGAAAATEAGIDAARIGGTIVLLGAVFPGPPIALEPETLVRRLLHLRGVHNYEARHLEQALSFLKVQEDRFPFAELVTVYQGLDRLDEAIAAAKARQSVRIGVAPQAE